MDHPSEVVALVADASTRLKGSYGRRELFEHFFQQLGFMPREDPPKAPGRGDAAHRPRVSIPAGIVKRPPYAGTSSATLRSLNTIADAGLPSCITCWRPWLTSSKRPWNSCVETRFSTNR